MKTKLDLFMQEIKAYDYKWFNEIGGNEALQEINELRKKAKIVDLPDCVCKSGLGYVSATCLVYCKEKVK